MMTVTEANDVNNVLRYFLRIPATGHWTSPPTREAAEESAQRLADAAYKRLSAGLTGERVAAAFDDWSAQIDAELGAAEASASSQEAG